MNDRPDRKCKVCTHTWARHQQRLRAGGHETEAGWCSCAEFVERKAKVAP